MGRGRLVGQADLEPGGSPGARWYQGSYNLWAEYNLANVIPRVMAAINSAIFPEEMPSGFALPEDMLFHPQQM